jgi:hypothetical protein
MFKVEIKKIVIKEYYDGIRENDYGDDITIINKEKKDLWEVYSNLSNRIFYFHL